MRAFPPPILALLVGIAIVLPSVGFQRAHYFCRMMDRVMASPCCEAEQETAAGEREQQLRATDCCVRVDPSAHKVASGIRATGVAVPMLALVAAIGDATYVPLRGREEASALRQEIGRASCRG